MKVGGLFDGCGLLAYGLHLAGLEHSWLCELDEFRRGILRQRFPGVPVYDDVRAVGPDAARVDVVAGGFPCKGVSSAGPRTGFGHPETALWREMFRVVSDLRPRYVIVENVADLLSLQRGELFSEVLGDLASVGYDAEWDCFPAAAFGAPHGRDRVFVTAVSHTFGNDGRETGVSGSCQVGPHENRGRPGNSGGEAVAYPERAGRVQGGGLREGDTSQGGRGRPVDRDREAASDADDEGAFKRERLVGQEVRGEERGDFAGRGVQLSWGAYEGAVRRWEGILGWPVPKPLLRRVDDGRSSRVERSRLSALGDGVLVQAGWLVGRRLVEYDLALASSACP